jgi:hypothetical protein
MQRCLDCNSVLTIKETACPTCGSKVNNGGVTLGEMLARLGTTVFYTGVLAFLVVRLAPEGTNFVAIFAVCAAVVLVAMRKKILER